MKSEWMVNQVYRNIDKDGVDHEGNREYSGGAFDSQKEEKVW